MAGYRLALPRISSCILKYVYDVIVKSLRSLSSPDEFRLTKRHIHLNETLFGWCRTLKYVVKPVP